MRTFQQVYTLLEAGYSMADIQAMPDEEVQEEQHEEVHAEVQAEAQAETSNEALIKEIRSLRNAITANALTGAQIKHEELPSAEDMLASLVNPKTKEVKKGGKK